MAGFALGGPVGAALGAEAGGTLGGVAGGEKVGQAALNALPAAGLAGVGGFGAEALGGVTPATGTDLFGVSGTPAPISGVGDVAGAGGGAWSDGTVPQQVTAGANTATQSLALPSDAAGGAGWTDSAAGAPPPSSVPTSSWTDTGAGSAAAAEAGGALKAGTEAGGGGWLSSISNTLGIPQGAVLPTAIAGAGLAKNLLTPSSLYGQSQLSGLGSNTLAQSQLMENYLNTGTLPPGVQTAIDSATKGAEAAIRGKYAAMGLSGSTMEQQELSNAKTQAVSAGAQVAINLYSQGLANAQISEGVYNTLLSTDVKQQELTSNAIANMAAALSGGSAYPYRQPQQQMPVG